MKATTKLYQQNEQGQYIAKAGKLGEAARKMAADKAGSVVFTCPNFAVIAVPHGELTLWAK